ncbi:hypothetical protein IM880_12985 [Pectobacterium polaris]|uniref:DUF2570 domain-containing protein n=1 Tax=Pectobacterium polaris TaxID=2042057 RepID=A0AAW4P0Z5_9GAMM|nr:hypothetical protein [Pectobacterium polaris]MBW5893130.1 hypothetical protein [Pectobacterium polaris]
MVKQILAGFWAGIWPYLMAVIVALVCYAAGKREGRSAAQLELSQAETKLAVGVLTEFIAGTRELTANANLASQQLALQINARQAADEQSTEAIRAALKKTAELRVMCVFDADVMQQLEAARERAASAATTGIASSTNGAMRAPGGSSQ